VLFRSRQPWRFGRTRGAGSPHLKARLACPEWEAHVMAESQNLDALQTFVGDLYSL